MSPIDKTSSGKFSIGDLPGGKCRIGTAGFIAVMLAAMLAACGSDPADDEDLVEEPAEAVRGSVSDSVRRPLEEAREVEALMDEHARATEAAIEDATQP